MTVYSYFSDGALLMSASSLNSRTWGGSIWVFKDPLGAPNENLCTAGVQTEAGVTDVAWVQEKGILVASDTGSVELWELLDNESLLANKFTTYEHDNIVTSLSVFTGGLQAVSGSKDCSVKVWDLSQKTPLKSYKGKGTPLLASVSEDCSVVVLNAESSVIFKDESHRDFVTGVAWSPVTLGTFTTVGWDHKVLHHTIQIDNPGPQA
uniref:Methylosome protein WDR77 n=1 Tax=Pyxicephalus adspersus TaxID=30357 RepID=A0AAV3BBB1_PYXAD|nr:TPA: hypothetical protein GDO54_001593 [Pyxicephalus adspersus]